MNYPYFYIISSDFKIPISKHTFDLINENNNNNINENKNINENNNNNINQNINENIINNKEIIINAPSDYINLYLKYLENKNTTFTYEEKDIIVEISELFKDQKTFTEIKLLPKFNIYDNNKYSNSELKLILKYGDLKSYEREKIEKKFMVTILYRKIFIT